MIYLVGVDHKVQVPAGITQLQNDAIEKFRIYLLNFIPEKQIDLIAEEYCDALAKQRANTGLSLLRTIATELKVEHRYCDPDKEEREKLGIYDDRTKAENIWAERLNDVDKRNALFICGGNHIDSFKELLEQQGKVVTVASSGWGDELDGEVIFGGPLEIR